MANETEKPAGPKVPAERPDPQAAARDPEPGSEDRAGFDLGGTVEPADRAHPDLPQTGPRGSPAPGGSATGRADGLTDPSGSRSLGNRAGEPGSASGSGATDGSGGPT